MPDHLGRQRRKRQLIRFSPQSITMNSKVIKSNPFHTPMEQRLTSHSNCHLGAGNPPRLVLRHEGVMRAFMMRGASFEQSHIEAQKKYPMVGRCL